MPNIDFTPCRFYLADDWTAKKLEVLVDIPDKLQLEHLRATGLQPGNPKFECNRFNLLVLPVLLS